MSRAAEKTLAMPRVKHHRTIFILSRTLYAGDELDYRVDAADTGRVRVGFFLPDRKAWPSGFLSTPPMTTGFLLFFHPCSHILPLCLLRSFVHIFTSLFSTSPDFSRFSPLPPPLLPFFPLLFFSSFSRFSNCYFFYLVLVSTQIVTRARPRSVLLPEPDRRTIPGRTPARRARTGHRRGAIADGEAPV